MIISTNKEKSMIMKMDYRTIFIVLFLLVPNYSNAFNISDCVSKYTDELNATFCINKDLTEIPKGFDVDIQHLDLSMNYFEEIRENTLSLENLQKLYLKNCSIQHIQRDAFAKLLNILEIDLTKNKISILHPDTFKNNEKLTSIYLNDNRIEILLTGLFKDLFLLEKIDLSNNHIYKIEQGAFEKVLRLNELFLNGNNLTILQDEVYSQFSTLKTFTLYDNPWICDCKMNPFKNFLISNKLQTKTVCESPPELAGQLLGKFQSQNFICKPIIMNHTRSIVYSKIGNTISLECIAIGDPLPNVYWKHDSNVIKRRHNPRYVLGTMKSNKEVTLTLVISNLTDEDRGNFSCIAENSGGNDEIHTMLNIETTPEVLIASTKFIMFMAFLVVSGVGMLIISFFFFRYCVTNYKKKYKRKNYITVEKLCHNNVSRNMNVINTSVQSLNRCVVPESDYAENNARDLALTNNYELHWSNSNLVQPMEPSNVQNSRAPIDQQYNSCYKNKLTEAPPRYSFQPPSDTRMRLERSVSNASGGISDTSTLPSNYRNPPDHKIYKNRRISNTGSQTSYMSVLNNQTGNYGVRPLANSNLINLRRSRDFSPIPRSRNVPSSPNYINHRFHYQPHVPQTSVDDNYETLQMIPIHSNSNTSQNRRPSTDMINNTPYKNETYFKPNINRPQSRRNPPDVVDLNSLQGYIV